MPFEPEREPASSDAIPARVDPERRDVDVHSEHSHALRTVARREHELLALSELSQELAISLDLYAIGNLVLLNLMGQLGTSRAALWLLPEERDRAPILIRSHGIRREMAAALGATASGMIESLSRERRIVSIEEIGAALPSTGLSLARREGIVLFAPIHARGDVLGFLALGSRLDGAAYDALELEALQASAGMAGVALQNAALYNRLFENNRKLRVANEDLLQLDRMKSEFLRNVNHELRTPLTVIIAYLDSVLEHQDRGTQLHEFLSVSLDEARKLKGMLEHLLDFGAAVRETLPLEIRQENPSSILRAFYEERLPGVTEGLREFSFRVDGEVPEGLFDRHRLLQIVDVLVDNAVKFTPPGTRIELRVRVIEREERPWVSIELTDNGPGIPADRIPHIFRSFQQGDGSTTREVGGLGLGLAFARQLAEMMSGHLSVESEFGRGSVFTLLLPVAPGFQAPG